MPEDDNLIDDFDLLEPEGFNDEPVQPEAPEEPEPAPPSLQITGMNPAANVIFCGDQKIKVSPDFFSTGPRIGDRYEG